MKNFFGLLVAVLLLGATAGAGRAQSSLSAPPTDQSKYRLMPNDRLAYRIEEDPVKSSDPIAVTVTPSARSTFKSPAVRTCRSWSMPGARLWRRSKPS